ncbi:MAG TPA: hypothetical protein VM734_09615 [Kofleriaceae bacterium]|nr:hypothetical protein [Kofleriaceae bacterium]
MTRLPPALAPWAHQLVELPGPLVAALAPWLGRLAVAIGPLPGDRHARTGELDGVDGLARRGDYQRLLAVEWALADELPDEFVRRAAGGEHLFIARAHRAPPVQRRSVVLISAGPSQLGAPRLVHLAALVVMARRAAVAGAELAWGVIEHPSRGLASSVEPAALERLLGARTAATAGADQAAAWRTALGPAAPEDLWLVGGAEQVELARALGAATLVVRDPFEPDVRAIDVEVGAPAGKARARVRLSLPPPDDTVRLLRDPFGRVVAPAPVRTALAPGAMWFVAGGGRLAIAHGDRIELWPVPSSPREPAGQPKVTTTPSTMTLVALGMRRRSVLTVTWSPDQPDRLWLREPSLGKGEVRITMPDVVARRLHAGRPAVRDRPGLVAYARSPSADGARRLIIEGPTGVLLQVVTASRSRELDATLIGPADADGEVIGAVLDGEVWFVEVTAGGEVELRSAEPEGPCPRMATRRQWRPLAGDPGVRWGSARAPRVAFGPIAVRLDERTWRIIAAGKTPANLEVSTPVHGVVVDADGPRLLCVGDGRHHVVLRGRDYDLALPRAGGEIVAVACGAPQPVIAWATRTETVVYSLVHEAVLLRIAREVA